MSRFPLFDRSQIRLDDVDRRGHDLTFQECRALAPPEKRFDHPELGDLAARIQRAKRQGTPIVLMMGAHPIKLGLSRYIIDLVERGLITHVATNGAGVIHDFELALLGGTSEDVPKWISVGQFGLWRETSSLNDIITLGAARGLGLGEVVGKTIEEQGFPHRELSIAAACWRKGIPLTSHVGVGSDITHAHPNCDGAALGQTSYTDFLIFARTIQDLDGGVFLNVGTAVAGPEVYLKALSMARNVARGQGKSISEITTAVFDLIELPADFRKGPPSKSHPQYYYRPWKTILVRTVADGGESYYFCGDHSLTIPTLWDELIHPRRASEPIPTVGPTRVPLRELRGVELPGPTAAFPPARRLQS